MSREVAAELVGDLPHERDLVAEAFRRCHDVTPRYPDARVPTRHAIEAVRHTRAKHYTAHSSTSEARLARTNHSHAGPSASTS